MLALENRLDAESERELDCLARRPRRSDDDDAPGRRLCGDERLVIGREVVIANDADDDPPRRSRRDAPTVRRENYGSAWWGGGRVRVPDARRLLSLVVAGLVDGWLSVRAGGVTIAGGVTRALLARRRLLSLLGIRPGRLIAEDDAPIRRTVPDSSRAVGGRRLSSGGHAIEPDSAHARGRPMRFRHGLPLRGRVNG